MEIICLMGGYTMIRTDTPNLDSYDNELYLKYMSKAEIDKAFHYLEGILKGINIDNVINERERVELKNWCDYYIGYTHVNAIQDVVNVIKNSVSDGMITAEEYENLLWLCNNFNTNNIYFDAITSDIQRLQGILQGIIADGIIRDEEIIALEKWIEDNEHLVNSYPYDEINSLLTTILADKIIDENERNLLKLFFSDFIPSESIKIFSEGEIARLRADLSIDGICSMNPEIIISEQIFCFTGISSKSSRKEINNIISTLGGSYIDRVTSKTNYLIIGNEGNRCWSYSCYGRKVEQAVNMRKQGNKILIVHENDFWDAVEDF